MFGSVCKIAKATISFVLAGWLSVRPHGTTRIPLDRFSWNFILSVFGKCVEKIWQEYCVLYMNSNKHLWSYLAQFFLEWKMFQTKVVEKINTHLMFNNFAFENCVVYEIIWKNIYILYSRTGHRWKYGACALHAIYLRLQTHTQIMKYCFCTATMVTWMHHIISLYVHCPSC
jgi:hypothetical protein